MCPHKHTPLLQNLLGGVKVRNLKTNELTDLPLAGLFFAIGECSSHFL